MTIDEFKKVSMCNFASLNVYEIDKLLNEGNNILSKMVIIDEDVVDIIDKLSIERECR